MPIYEYKCSNCREITEVYQRTSAPLEVSCEHCGSRRLERVVSIPGMVKVSTVAGKGTTCCGRSERCDTPPCSVGEGCRRDQP